MLWARSRGRPVPGLRNSVANRSTHPHTVTLLCYAGIGLGIATDLLKEGYFVFANGRSAERLEKAFATLKQDKDVQKRLV